jgi:plastocyanin
MPFRKLCKHPASLITYLLTGFTAFCVQAKTLVIVDQFDQPVENAVVELLNYQSQTLPSDIAVMDQVDKQFSPKLLTIVAGQQVSFPNSDDIRHHVYSFSPAKPFELKLYAGTPKAPIVFENSGVVVLGCNIHDSMVGYIYVAQSPAIFVSNAQGEVVLPEDASEYLLWHPEQSDNIDERRTVIWQADHKKNKVSVDLVAPAPRNTFGEKFKEHHGH